MMRTGRAPVTGVETYLRQLDDAWEHKWESLRAVLDGVSEEEAAWQPPCYAAEEREEGWPPPGTIRWQVAHIVDGDWPLAAGAIESFAFGVVGFITEYADRNVAPLAAARQRSPIVSGSKS